MMKYLAFFVLMFSFLHASKILSYNVYDRTDRADVMVTFDTPYNGVIKQSISKSKITIKLAGASIESSKIKNISSRFLSSITITPMLNKTQIVAVVPSYVKLVASKTADGYGLRLRFIKKNAVTKKAHNNIIVKEKSASSDTGLPTLKNVQISQSYYIVVGILIIGIGILFYLKSKITPKNNSKKESKNSWSFKNTQNSLVPATTQDDNSEKLSIRFQKELNDKNSVVMLDFSEYSYLLIVGEGNILLDKFTDNKPATEEDFNSILKDRHQELSDFLEAKQKTAEIHPKDSPFEALQSYKEKAATMIYES